MKGESRWRGVVSWVFSRTPENAWEANYAGRNARLVKAGGQGKSSSGKDGTEIQFTGRICTGKAFRKEGRGMMVHGMSL